MERLPRYEAHLSRELDRSLARLRTLQEMRRSALFAEPGALSDAGDTLRA
jgi:hypothetical protein